MRWPDRWLEARDRLLASRVFQRRAARFALTRPIARRRASQLFDLVAGFVYSQVLLACVQLKLFDRLALAPATAAVLALELKLALPAAERLLSAAVALRLLELRSGARYGLGALGAPLVGNTALAAMIEHHRALYQDLADPVALLRQSAAVDAPGGDVPARALASFWPYAGAASAADLPAAHVADYSALMSASQPLVADEVLDAYDISGHRCLLDIGGGEGNFLIAAAQRAPALRLQLFDLPPVAALARQHLADSGLSARVQTHGGDFFCDALPTGADLASLVRVVHDHDDARVLSLLRAVRLALAPGGTLLLAEPMADAPGAAAMGDAYFGFYLLAMGRGQPRSAARLTQLLLQSGFVRVTQRHTAMPLQVGVLLASTSTAGLEHRA